jgi:hypothetical protein
MSDFKKLFTTCLSAFLLLAVVTGCEIVRDTFPESEKNGKIVCLIDGVKFEAAGNKSIAAMDFIVTEMEKKDDTYLLTVFAISQHKGTGALAVGFKIAGSRLEDLEPGVTLTQWNYNEAIVGSFEGVMGGVEGRTSKDSDDTVFKASSNHADKMSLTVTEIDLSKKSISGTFQFEAKDQETEKFVEVTNGEFRNVQWTEVGNSEPLSKNHHTF